MSGQRLMEHIKVDFPIVVMTLFILASAVAVVYTKHAYRSEFVALQQMENQRDDLNEEWGRLLLEQSTWGSPGRVEQQARIKLNMAVPTHEATVMVQP